jgi:membrane protease YdiL (CAAX protease family)
VSSAVIVITLTVLAVTLGKEKYLALANNPYFYIPMGTLAMHAIGFPFFWLCIRSLPTRRQSSKNSLTVLELLATIPIMQFVTNIGSSIGMGFDGIMQELFHTTSENPVDMLTEGVPVWLMLTITVVIVPILEELIFRKLLLDRLSIYGNVFAIIISAALFGLFHGNLYQLFYAFFAGLILGYVTVKGGSWLYGVGLHIFMNFLNGALPTMLEGHFEGYETAVMAFLEGNGDVFIANFQSFMIAGSFAIIISMLSVAGTIIFIYSIVKKTIYVRNAPEASIPAGKLPVIIFANVGMILFLAFSAFSIVSQYISIL